MSSLKHLKQFIKSFKHDDPHVFCILLSDELTDILNPNFLLSTKSEI